MRDQLRRMAGRLLALAGVLSLLAGGASLAQGRADLAVVKPVTDCAALAQGPVLSQAVGAAVTAQAKLLQTPKGLFCRVTGVIAPAIGFEVDLPTANWTQRFIQAGCGGLCGMINASIGDAGQCQPALDGQFALAVSDLGHKGRMGAPDEGAFAADPQKRIDFAYRANHLTALAAKALIKRFYGQAQRYAYFSGCSDGGREALMEAQRFPDDFDGVSAGAPAMMFQIQNSFYHAWTVAANTGLDGRRILLAAKLPILHAAVIAHCDLLDGIKDGLLSDPRACKVDPAWVLCAPGATDTSQCLTAAEWAVAARIYAGPTDAQGRQYLPGGVQPGSELQWSFATRTAADTPMGARMIASMSQVVLADPADADADAAHYAFNPAQFARVSALHSLNDATNTDLQPFAQHGGKLILWHGWSDDSIAPLMSIAYYKGVQQTLGAGPTDRFVRLFMLPGVGHCGGGDGFAQVDTLSPLMAWVEIGEAPKALIAGQIPDRRKGPGPANGADGRGGERGGPPPEGPGLEGPSVEGPPPGDMGGPPPAGAQHGDRPPGGAGGFGPGGAHPYAAADQAALASRPIFPFPLIPHYVGQGDPKAAASYIGGPSPVEERASLPWFGSALIGPGQQKDYAVKDGVLTVVAP